MEYKSDINLERIHLKNTISIVTESHAAIERETIEKEQLLTDLLRNYSSASPEFYNDIPITEQLLILYRKLLLDYEAAKSKPYFGKIIFDILPSAERQVLYIGKHGIDNWNESGTKLPVVIDWRAPVSELYYSTAFGKTAYLAPAGLIDAEVFLKTSFDINDAELLDLYDSDIMANDELLIKYLSRNKDAVLSDIVATIQKDQNTIIRLNPFSNVIVQGVAGSGKTTVAIHRISYLLYNFKDELNTDNVCVIASSKLFLNYMTSMLPDLDVPDIRQSTMSDLFTAVIREYDPKFHSLLSADAIDVTNPFADTNSIIKYYSDFETAFYDNEGDLELLGFTLLSRDDIDSYVNSRRRIKLLDRARELDTLIIERLNTLKEHIITHISNNKNDPDIQAFCKDTLKLDSSSIFEDNIRKIYPRLLSKYKNYYFKKLKKTDYYSALHDCIKSTKRVRKKAHSLRELSMLALSASEMKLLDSAKNIRHIVIDEAQDFNPSIYYCLIKIFANANFTLVGDVMQNISDSGLKSWDDLTYSILSPADFRTLTKSYRNTIQISQFASALVKNYSDIPLYIEPVIRNGPAVRFYPAQPSAYIISGILAELSDKSYNVTAIICRDSMTVSALKSELPSRFGIQELTPEHNTLETGIYILSLKDSKGLEFDAVILADFDAYSLNSAEIQQIYVAITRALHELHILSDNNEISHLNP